MNTTSFIETAIINLIALSQPKEWIAENLDYHIGIKDKSLPCIDYVLEDKSKYVLASTTYNPRIRRNYIDVDNDFIVGDSGGILPKVDFIFINTHKFTEVADFYTKYNRYCYHSEDSIEYKKFWARETKRRREGLTRKCKLYIKDIKEYFNPLTSDERKSELLHPLHITGDHYNYLNYSRIERTPNDEERLELDAKGLYTVETVEAFPRFWDWDYWGFKVLQFGEINKLNNCIAKSRRKGWSYKNGSSSASALNIAPATTVIHCADNLDFLTDDGALSTMTKTNLEWYETKTYWKRGFLSENYEKGIVLGYKKTSEGNKRFGYKSRLLSYAVGRNTSAAIGKKGKKIKVEEAGKLPTLMEFLEVTTSNMESGKIQVGNMDIWGTGGTKGTNWENFEKVYYNPHAYHIIPFENIWDDNKRHEVCGYFHPQVFDFEPYIWDGNSLLFESYKVDKEDKEYAKKHKGNSDYLIHCAQRANKPSEAFINTVENLFASPELNTHINDLKNDSNYQFYQDGWYVFNGGVSEFYEREKCIRENIFGNVGFHEFITDVPHKRTTDVHGCIREYYPPFKSEGEIPTDLYFITVDPYGVDKRQQEVTDKHSLYSFTVWMRANTLTPYGGKIMVAEYAGRLDKMEDNDRLLWAACIRWKAKALVETNRGETVSNFKKWGVQRLLLNDPTEYQNNNTTISSTTRDTKIGMTIGDGDKKLGGLTLLKDYLYEITGYNVDGDKIFRVSGIPSLPFCLELQKYDFKGNFDRISNVLLAMYEFKKDELLKRNALFKKSSDKPKRSMYERLTKS